MNGIKKNHFFWKILEFVAGAFSYCLGWNLVNLMIPLCLEWKIVWKIMWLWFLVDCIENLEFWKMMNSAARFVFQKHICLGVFLNGLVWSKTYEILQVKLDILGFILIGNISHLDQWIERYDFSKFDHGSRMKSMAAWVWQIFGEFFSVIDTLWYFSLK